MRTISMILSILLGLLITAVHGAAGETETVSTIKLSGKCVALQEASRNVSIVALIGRNTDFNTLLSAQSSFLEDSFQADGKAEVGMTMTVGGSEEPLRMFCFSDRLLLVLPPLDRTPTLTSSCDLSSGTGDLALLSFAVSVADVILYVADDNIRQTDVEFLSILAVQKHFLGSTRDQAVVVTMRTGRRHMNSHRWHAPVTHGRGEHSPAQQLRSAFAVHTVQHLGDVSSEYMSPLLKNHPGRLNLQSSATQAAQKYSHFMLQGNDFGTIPTMRCRATHRASALMMDDLYHAVDRQLMEHLEGLEHSTSSEDHHQLLLQGFESKCNSTRLDVLTKAHSPSTENLLLNRIEKHRLEFRLAYYEQLNHQSVAVERVKGYVIHVFFRHAALSPDAPPLFPWCNSSSSSSRGGMSASGAESLLSPGAGLERISAYECGVNTLLALQVPAQQRSVILTDVELLDHYDNLVRNFHDAHVEVAAGDYILQLSRALDMLFSIGQSKSEAMSYLLKEIEREGTAGGMSSSDIEAICDRFSEHVRHIQQPPPAQMTIMFGHAVAKRNVLRLVTALVVSVVVTVFLPHAIGAVLPALSAFQTAALTGALASTSAGLVNKQKDLLPGAARGFILGGAASLIGDALPVLDAHKAFSVGNAALRVGLESAVGCAASEMTGGVCKHGALQGAVGELTSSLQAGLDVRSSVVSSVMSGTAAGVVAENTGGNFEEAFLQGVLIGQLNHAAHQLKDVVLPEAAIPAVNPLEESISTLHDRIDELSSRADDLSFMEHMALQDMQESLHDLYATKYTDHQLEGMALGAEYMLEGVDVAMDVLPATKLVGKIPVKVAKKAVAKLAGSSGEKIKFLKFAPENSKITVMERGGGVVKFNGVEYRNVRDLGHVSTPELQRMASKGTNPVDQFGNKMNYHHHRQLDHRDPNGRLIEIRQDVHKLGNKAQHPHPRDGGLSAEVRTDYNRERQEFNKARAEIELNIRNVK